MEPIKEIEVILDEDNNSIVKCQLDDDVMVGSCFCIMCPYHLKMVNKVVFCII